MHLLAVVFFVLSSLQEINTEDSPSVRCCAFGVDLKPEKCFKLYFIQKCTRYTCNRLDFLNASNFGDEVPFTCDNNEYEDMSVEFPER